MQNIYRSLSQLFLRINWRKPISGGRYAKLLEAFIKGDLKKGDKVEILGLHYIFLGLNGTTDYPTPIFEHFSSKKNKKKEEKVTFDVLKFPVWRKV